MKDSCDHLDDLLLKNEKSILRRHGKIYQRLYRIKKLDDAILRYINDNPEIMESYREVICGYHCPSRYDCKAAQKYLPEDEGK